MLKKSLFNFSITFYYYNYFQNKKMCDFYFTSAIFYSSSQFQDNFPFKQKYIDFFFYFFLSMKKKVDICLYNSFIMVIFIDIF